MTTDFSEGIRGPVRCRYKVGDRIELISMPDDPRPVPVGTRGIINSVNRVDLGKDRFFQIGVSWENGSRLMLSMPPDKIRKIEE